MAQRGIMSFFGKVDSKSPDSSSLKSKPSPASSKAKQVTREKLGDETSPDETGKEKEEKELVCSGGDSPIFKKKGKSRKRVIFDSDEEEEEDKDKEEKCIMKAESQNVNGTLKENGSTENGAEEVMEEDAIEDEGGTKENEAGLNDCVEATTSSVESQSSQNGSISLPSQPPHSLANSDLLKTPPKRATARKHTGKRSRYTSTTSTTPTSSSSVSSTTTTTSSSSFSSKSTTSVDHRLNGNVCSSSSPPAKKLKPEPSEEKEATSDEVSEKEKKLDNVEMETISPQTKPSGEEMVTPVRRSNKKNDSSSTPRSESSTPRSEKKMTSKTIHPFFTTRTPKRGKVDSQLTSPPSGTSDVKVDHNERSSGGSSPVSSSQSSPTGQRPSSDTGGGTTSEGYDPTRKGYHPVEHACWKRGDKVPYLALARTFERIEEESKRLKIIATLTNLFRSVIALSPDELVKCVYLCLNKLAPAYEGTELGIGDSILIKAIAGATGRSVQKIKNEVIKKGDLGLVAESSRSNQRMMFAPPKLTVSGVFSKLKEIAGMSGNASMSKKVDLIKGMFVACQQCEARYLIRSLGGKLRIGLAEQSVLVAIGHATVYTPPGQDWPLGVVDASSGASSSEQFHKTLEKAVLTIKTCYCEHPNYDHLISSLIHHGLSELPAHCRLTPGIPLKPMLAHPTKGTQEVLQRFENATFTCEWKYDGERAQVHVLDGGEVKIYSRNSENNTTKYPDIISRMPKVLKESVTSCVIDGEAVAWDTEKGEILPFQILSTRKRKDASEADITVQVCVFAFDLLYLNDRSLVREPLKTRRELLRSSFNEIEGEFVFAKSMDGNNVEEIQEFLEESVRGNCEGLMVKTLEKDATYEIAKRSHNWLKLKKDYLEGVGDTLDLVVVGGFHGTGKRTGKYGGFLLACYDEDNEEYQVICKIGTGFKDEELEQHTKFFSDNLLEGPKPYYRYNDGTQPDLWFNAVQVWEVKAADLSISPVYTAAAGIVDEEKGISLRFPRFLRIREDKTPEQATSSTQVAEMYRSQVNSIKTSTSSSTAPDNDDMY